MDLRYNVIIDTKQAQVATEELEEYFESLGKSSEKSIKNLGRFGSEFVQELRQGKTSTEEARRNIEGLQKELRRLTNEGKTGSKEDRIALKQINAELVNLQRQVKRTERSRTDAHRKGLQQLKTEEREQKKQIANEERLERQRKRSGMMRTRYAGAQLRKGSFAGTGLDQVGGMLGTGFGMMKFGWIAAVIAAIGALVSRYKDALNVINNSLNNILDTIGYFVDSVVGSVINVIKEKYPKIAQYLNLDNYDINAKERLLNSKYTRERKNYDDARANIDKLGSTKQISELTSVLEDLKKTIPSLKGYSDEQIVRMKSTELVKMLDSEFEKRFDKIVDDTKDYITSENNKRINEYRRRIDEIDNEIGSIGYYDDDDIRHVNDEEIKEIEALIKEREEVEKKIEEETKVKQELIDAEKRAVRQQNALTKIIEKRQKEEERRKQRINDLKTIKGIAKGAIQDMPDYDTALYVAQEKYREQMLQLDKLKPTKSDSKEYNDEWEKARKRVETELQESQRVANEAVKDLIENIETQLDGTIESEYQKTLRSIEDGCKELNEQIDKMLGDTERAAELKGKVERISAIKNENAQVAETIRLLKEESELRIEEIELNEDRLDDYEVEKKVLNERIEATERIIDTLQNQTDLTEEERREIERYIRELRKLKVQLDKTNESQENFVYNNRMANLQNVAQSIGGNSYADAVGSAFSSILQGLQMGKDLKSGNMTRGQATSAAVAAGVQFGLQQFDLISKYVKNSKEALEEWNNTLEDSAHKLVLLNLEEWEYKQKNLFGVENPYDKLNQTLIKESKATQATSEALNKLASGKVQTGMKNKYDAGEMASIISGGIASGAVIGAAVGSAGSWVGTVIGAVAGAVTGTVTGLIAAKEKVAVYDSLKNRYGTLFDSETLEINKQILADYDKMDEKTKKLIDNAKELLEIQKEAREEYENYITEMVGQMGTDISDVMLQAFRNDKIYDAVDDVKDYVADTMTSLLSKQIFSEIFGTTFDNLSERLTSGILKMDDNGVLQVQGDINDELTSIVPQIRQKTLDYKKLMEEIQAKFGNWGYDIFGNDEETQQQLTGAISGMTEETASKINGNFFGLKLTAMEISDKVSSVRSMVSEMSGIATSSLSVLREIAENTYACRKIDNLASDISYIKNNGIAVR